MFGTKKSTTLIVTLLVILGLGGGFWGYLQSRGKLPDPTSENLGAGTSAPDTNASCQIADAPSGIFNYGGSTTWAPIRQITEPVIKRICPQFGLRYTYPINQEPGSETGIQMLIANQLAFSQSSTNVKPQENQQAQENGFSLREIPVAIDGIAIAVHPSLNIPALSIAQVKDIYTGKITNWNQIGGSNLTIIPYSRRKEAGGTVNFFVDNVLNKEKFGANVQYVYSTTPAIQKVSGNPGAIYYASAPEIIKQCKVKPLPLFNAANVAIAPYKEPPIPLESCREGNRNQLNFDAIRSGDYPITRKLFAIVKMDGKLDQQAGEAYANWLLTAEGQKLIQEANFVSIK